MRRNGMFERGFSAITLAALALNIFVAPTTGYDCDKLESDRCSESDSLDDFDICIVTHSSVSELIQCAAQAFDDIRANINGDPQTVPALEILRKVSGNQTCNDDSLSQALHTYDAHKNGPFITYLCKEKVKDRDICALSSCLNIKSDERSINQWCSSDDDEPELMSQSALSTCRNAASTPTASSTSAPTGSTLTTRSAMATNKATTQTTTPTATSISSATPTANGAPGSTGNMLASASLFAMLVIWVLYLL